MITVVRTNGQIAGVCEWWLVNDLGNQDWTYGTVVWVEQVECADGVRATTVFRDIIAQIAAMVPQATGAYWVRRDKTSYKLHAFRRDQLVKGGMTYASV